MELKICKDKAFIGGQPWWGLTFWLPAFNGNSIEKLPKKFLNNFFRLS
jgi:hypothetical protein